MRWLTLGLLLVATAGCKSNPYCLNCKDSGNGVVTPPDFLPPPLPDAGELDLSPEPIDLTGSTICVITNNGVEICDNLDNDCNGIIDDVAKDKLATDPNNCGVCFNKCTYLHAFGACVPGTNGAPTCQATGCQPGYVDLDHNLSNGCEYVCTPSMPPTEVCDGKDNNCDGVVDEGFTAHWADAQKQQPLYDSSTTSCGQCATVCSLGPGTLMACQGSGPGGRGQCAVVACFNGNDANNVHQTYRHNPATGPIDATGCEVHCNKPAAETGKDCNPDGACTFPSETCNNLDDDCDFVVDDHLTEIGLGGACPDGVPGKYCTGADCGRGICNPGIYQCSFGVLTCNGSIGPRPDVCNGVDDNCDGKIDESYTTTWQANGQPAYDKLPQNCGACGNVCNLANAVNGCRLAAGDTLGSCNVIACNSGYFYPPKTNSSPLVCDKSPTGPQDSTHITPGIGCYYHCLGNNSPEICDGIDNDCNGCIDDQLSTAPDICSHAGVCVGNPVPTNKPIPVVCSGAAGWKCDYTAVPNISLDASGNLGIIEKQCDNLDNNCSGACDENFPDVLVNTAGCNNTHSARACTAGLGICQNSGVIACANSGGGTTYNDVEKCNVTADMTKAKNEACNGVDDDCDGLIDEASNSTIGSTTYLGWHDLATLVNGVYVYQYEATRPDATVTTAGSNTVRACSKANALPWANVTKAQAEAACAAVKDSTGASGRLCTATEWQTACGATGSGSHWSYSTSPATWTQGVCNDASVTTQRCAVNSDCLSGTCNASKQCTCNTSSDCSIGFLCPPLRCVGQTCSTDADCLSGSTCDISKQCTCTTNSNCKTGFTCQSPKVCTGSGAWPTGSAGPTTSAACHTSSSLYDMSGNLQEWTSTAVVLKSGTGATLASSGQSGVITVNGLTNMYQSDVGAQLVLSGAGNANNNGTFDIVAWNSASSVNISSGGTTPDAGPITWQFSYYKVRGGNYSTSSSPANGDGTSCEFDFDIQRAGFANNNLGFRCCFDHAP